MLLSTGYTIFGIMNSRQYQKIGEESHEDKGRNTGNQSAKAAGKKASRLPNKILKSLRISQKKVEKSSDCSYTRLDGQSNAKVEKKNTGATAKNSRRKPDSLCLSHTLMEFSYSYFPLGCVSYGVAYAGEY